MCDYYTTTLVKGRNGKTPRCVAERFWPKVIVGKAWECWEWTGAGRPGDYGRIQEAGKGSRLLLAHRVAWEMEYGPIPEGLVIDHLCRNRRCVNVHHLEVVTYQVNILRGDALHARAHVQNTCIRGHLLVGENVISFPCGTRWCRICSSQWRRKRG